MKTKVIDSDEYYECCNLYKTKVVIHKAAVMIRKVLAKTGSDQYEKDSNVNKVEIMFLLRGNSHWKQAINISDYEAIFRINKHNPM